MIIISITPDFALDCGYTYAGGLGVLEGDKFYAAAKLGLNYIVFTLLYRNGYVEYEFDEKGSPIPRPQPQPREFLEELKASEEITITLRGEEVKLKPWIYRLNTARAVFFEPVEPDWAAKLADRLYIEECLEEKFYKYVLLAKATAEYIRKNINLERVKYIDLQEAYAAMLPLILKIPGKYRLIIHTPGPWGHPRFPRELFEREFGYRFINDNVVLTDIGLAASREVFTVSAKHYDVMNKIIPHFIDKVRYVTNGVNIDRWMDPYLKKRFEENTLTLEEFIKLRKSIRARFESFLRSYKEDVEIEDKLVVAWCRRLVPYKRPEFVMEFIEKNEDLPMIYVIAGKSHPQDSYGLQLMEKLNKLHGEKENVIYIPNYGVAEAKEILKGADLLLFTPFPGWEASGTSFMKAGINGVPTLSSRDGSAIEFIVDRVNGWLFGEDLRELVNIHIDPRARRINEREYREFEEKLIHICDLYFNQSETFYKVALNAMRTFVHRVNIERVLKEYYPDIVK